MVERSEQSRQAILKATMDLLDERNPDALSVRKLSIERIAREAGVSKTTIYRWWSSKAEVVLDTILDNHLARTPVRADLPALDALREHLASLAVVYADWEGRLMAQLIAECQSDPEAMKIFHERFFQPRSQTAIAIVERAVEEGLLRSDIDAQAVAERLYAPLYFRLLLHVGGIDRSFTDAVLDSALSGIASNGENMRSDR